MRLLALAFVITLLASCSSHYSIGNLAGKYVRSVGGGMDTITLNANGTYTETYRSANLHVSHQDGTWTLDELEAGPTVALNNFRPPLAKNGQRRGIYLLLVQKSFGNLYLITNIDLGKGYKRQP